MQVKTERLLCPNGQGTKRLVAFKKAVLFCCCETVSVPRNKSTGQASTEALPIYFFAFPDALADFLAAGDLPPAFFTTFLLLAFALAANFFAAAALPAGFFAIFELGFFGDFEAVFYATALFLVGVFLAPGFLANFGNST